MHYAVMLAELVMHAKVAFLHFDSVCSVKPNLAKDGQVDTNLQCTTNNELNWGAPKHKV